MMYEYESENGFKGIFTSGFFPGIGKHYDLTIYEKEPGDFSVPKWNMVYHATYGCMISEQEFKNAVDEFPEYRKELLGL